MKTTETRFTIQTTVSVNDALWNELQLIALEHGITTSRQLRIIIMRWLIYVQRNNDESTGTNHDYLPVTKHQIRMPRMAWEFLEMTRRNKSRFVNDALSMFINGSTI